MSKLYDSFKTPDDEYASSWFLRTSDGTIYGPIELSSLVDWARQNRIAPGNKISSRQKDWAAAETFPELEMEWMVPLKEGRVYGPIHRMAALYLVRQGTVTPDTVLTNKITGKEVVVQALLDAEAQQLPLAEVLDDAREYHLPKDKPGTDQVPPPLEKDRLSPEDPKEERRSFVSQMALELSGYVESLTGAKKRKKTAVSMKGLLPPALKRRRVPSINRRLTKKVEQLQEQLLAERLRVQELQKEFLEHPVAVEEDPGSAEEST